MTVEGIVLGQTIAPVNQVTDEGTKSTDFDLSVGPLSITSDGATSHCDSGPGFETCESSLNNLLFKLYGLNIITAGSVHSQSNSSVGTSNDNGTSYSNVCILQSAGNPCTVVTAGQNDYDIDIPGVAQGVITISAEGLTTTEGGVRGSGLTVTMLRLDLTTPGWPGRARSREGAQLRWQRQRHYAVAAVTAAGSDRRAVASDRGTCRRRRQLLRLVHRAGRLHRLHGHRSLDDVPTGEAELRHQRSLVGSSRTSRRSGRETGRFLFVRYSPRRRIISWRTKGFISFSTPMRVSFMWPGSTIVSSGSTSSLSMMLAISWS